MRHSQLPHLARLTARADWSQWDPWGGLRGMLGVALPLTVGLATGQMLDGVVAASGALALGIGSFRKGDQAHPAVLVLGGLAMAFSTAVGTLAGSHPFLSLWFAALWGFAGGLLFELNLPLSFVGNKAILAILIAGGYPSGGAAALHRSLLVFLGGLLQALLALGEGPLRDRAGLRPRSTGEAPSFLKTLPAFFDQLTPHSPLFQAALRLGLALGASDLLSRHLGLTRAYWMPMTVLLILRPDFDQTFGRGLGRLAGTFGGAAAATLLTLWLHPTPLALTALVLLFAWACFTLFGVNYALFAVALTAYVVLMVTLAGTNEGTAVHDRIVGNLAGGFFAMAVFLAWPIRKTGDLQA